VGARAVTDVKALVLIQQAHGTECAPHSAEAGPDDQDLLFHIMSSRGVLALIEN
jgi:hypothetical protein